MISDINVYPKTNMLRETEPFRYNTNGVLELLRGDDQQGWDNFKVKVCENCSKHGKNIAFEIANLTHPKMKRTIELNYYDNFPHYGLPREKCPVCQGKIDNCIIREDK